MKVIITLTIVGFVGLVYSSMLPETEFLEVENFDKPKCPPTSAKVIVFPNPDNCTTFYQCSGGYAWEMRCYTGLHWNAKIERCDFPENACCDPEYDVENKCEKNK